MQNVYIQASVLGFGFYVPVQGHPAELKIMTTPTDSYRACINSIPKP